MGIKAIEGLAPEWFTPAGQDGDDQTRFKVRPLNGAEFGEVADAVEFTKAGAIFISHTGRERCLNMALLGWENFSGNTGPIEFNNAAMRLIPHEVRVQIVSRIMAISTLDKEQEKN